VPTGDPTDKNSKEKQQNFTTFDKNLNKTMLQTIQIIALIQGILFL
jgi:hypothetical protein